jgi:death-on-curing protein
MILLLFGIDGFRWTYFLLLHGGILLVIVLMLLIPWLTPFLFCFLFKLLTIEGTVVYLVIAIFLLFVVKKEGKIIQVLKNSLTRLRKKRQKRIGAEQIEYFDKEAIIALHDQIIRDTGGEEGIRYDANLDFLVYKVQRYKTNLPMPERLFWKAAIYLTKLANSHAFWDGNKRSAMMVCDSFLIKHGFYLDVSVEEAIPFLFKIAALDQNEALKEKTLKEVKEWIEQRIKSST